MIPLPIFSPLIEIEIIYATRRYQITHTAAREPSILMLILKLNGGSLSTSSKRRFARTPITTETTAQIKNKIG
jgi:hypothetical protein